jgi:methyl-accepting chemotaxis protein
VRLSTRILVSYGYLATLLLVGAAGAALAFNQLGGTIGRVLGENLRSVQAGIDMLESLERQERAVLALFLDRDTRPALGAADEAFLAALDAARSNLTIESEGDIIARIEERFAAYRMVRDEVVAAPAAERLRDYDARALPRFAELKQSVRELIGVNHEAMERADARARRAATANAALHALLVALALLSLAPLSASMRRHVFARLEELGEVSEAISAGDLGRRLDDRHVDELGLAGRQLNRVLDRYQMLEAELAGRRAHERGLVRCLLKLLPEPAVLFSPSGEILDSTLDPAMSEAVRRAAEEQVQEMDESVETELTVDHRRVRLLPLKPEGRPQLAWLALVSKAE